MSTHMPYLADSPKFTREIQNNFVELNPTRAEKVDTRVMHFQEQPSSPGGNHTITMLALSNMVGRLACGLCNGEISKPSDKY